jgi:transposase-like protein
MALTRRRVTRACTLQMRRDIEVGPSTAQVAREPDRPPNQSGKWRREHAKDAEHAFAGNGHRDKEAARIADLDRLVGRFTMASAVFKNAVAPLAAPPHERTDTRGRCWLTCAPRMPSPRARSRLHAGATWWRCPGELTPVASLARSPKTRPGGVAISAHAARSHGPVLASATSRTSGHGAVS